MVGGGGARPVIKAKALGLRPEGACAEAAVPDAGRVAAALALAARVEAVFDAAGARRATANESGPRASDESSAVCESPAADRFAAGKRVAAAGARGANAPGAVG